MNIRDFLIENYIWILVVILLSIVTVIGFLADKQKNNESKKKDKNQSPANPNLPVNNMDGQAMAYQNQQSMNINYQQNTQPNNQTQVNYQGTNPSYQQPMNVPNNQLNQFTNVQPNSSIPNGMPSGTIPNPVNNQNGALNQNINIQQPINNQPPVEVINTTNDVIKEPIYQPLSEQRPVIQPKEIQPINQINNQNTFDTIPSPLTPPTESIQPMNNSMNNSMNNQMNFNQVNNNQMAPLTPIQSVPNQYQNIPNNIQNNVVNNAVEYQSVNNPVQPNIQANYQMPVENNYQQPSPIQNNTIPNPVATPQPVTPQPINFVYGPQQNNNNQNMQQ